jgi:hypothetical protein
MAGGVLLSCRYVGPWQEYQLAKLRSDAVKAMLSKASGRLDRIQSAPEERMKDHLNHSLVRPRLLSCRAPPTPCVCASRVVGWERHCRRLVRCVVGPAVSGQA